MLTDRIEFLLPRGLSRGAANRPKQQLLTALIFCVDRWFTHKPNCIFRAQLQRLHTEVVLSDGTLGRAGDRVIDLHFWNEQIPIPAEGPSLAWGHQVSGRDWVLGHVSCGSLADITAGSRHVRFAPDCVAKLTDGAR